MTFSAEVLLARLRDLQGSVIPGRYLVAFSGGLDSTVLLHAMAQAAHAGTFPGTHLQTSIVAVHVDHGLHPDAGAWEEHCREFAKGLGVTFISRRVEVNDQTGVGVEAAARSARYSALAALMQDKDVLLTAHHQDDQAETLLLNLMRGSGLRGLSGIRASRQFGPGLLLRPMLDNSRADIEAYARECDLHWLDDPSNLKIRFDRNYLRREIVPRLRERWPAATTRLARSCELASEAAGLLDEVAQLDLQGLVGLTKDGAGSRPDRLDVSALSGLSDPRQRNVLRYAIKACGLAPPPASRLRQIQDELLPARDDAQPLVSWRGGEARRFRNQLYLLDNAATGPCPVSVPAALSPDDERAVSLGSLGELRLERSGNGDAPGIDPGCVARGLQLRFRQGGETIRPYGHADTRPLKKLLQEQGVVPWMRRKLPLLYAGDTLVAVADLWIAADCARKDGYRVRWSGRPPIF